MDDYKRQVDLGVELRESSHPHVYLNAGTATRSPLDLKQGHITPYGEFKSRFQQNTFNITEDYIILEEAVGEEALAGSPDVSPWLYTPLPQDSATSTYFSAAIYANKPARHHRFR